MLKKLQDLTEKANGDKIGNAVATLFVKPYISIPINVEFTMEMTEEGDVPEWITRFDEDRAIILVHPLAVFRYIRRMRDITLSESDEEDFIRCRSLSLLQEIGKLPDIHILFMVVLQRVAYMLEIAHLEKRGGIVEVAEGEAYHTLLWAFKEVEQFVLRTSGVNVRAHYGISWYESDWITGR